MERNERNIGLDVLRNMSMMMIVTLHYLSKGGVLWNTAQEYTLQWYMVWFLEAICYTSVNIYVLISAFFLSTSAKKKVQWKKVFEMLATMCFYSWIIGGALWLSGICSFNIKDILCVVFPFITKSYWFINVYIVMYMLYPYINRGLLTLEKKDYQILISICVIFFSISQSVLPFVDWTLDETHGYGIIWFVTLYIIGSYIRKYPPKVNLLWSILIFLLCGLMCVACRRILLILLSGKNLDLADIWYAYNSFPVFIGSIFLFCGFKNLRINNNFLLKCMKWCTPGTLGVYLFHEQYKLRQIIWIDLLHVDKYYNSFFQFIHLVFVVVVLFGIGIMVDCIRRKIIAGLFSRISLSERGNTDV